MPPALLAEALAQVVAVEARKTQHLIEFRQRV
jgi:hypothetical protein